ncbi:hypothetical protein [Morganella psychrotolerans]|nr:hypothetical protein [Morganella psychrotolerans]
MGDKIQSVTIGDITISQFGDGQLWLEDSVADDSGSFQEKAVADALKKFYESNF